jgi:hypothetical protein
MSFDLEKTEEILKNAKSTLDDFPLYERELKYKYLQSFYSKAYMSGSDWYVGPSIREYIEGRDIRLLFRKDYKLQLLMKILDNNMFPPTN